MDCAKCAGFMVRERVRDFFLPFYTWRCLNCGALIDRVGALNRRRRLPVQGWKSLEHYRDGAAKGWDAKRARDG